MTMRFLKFLFGFVLLAVAIALGFSTLFMSSSGTRWAFLVITFVAFVGAIYLVRHN